MKFGSLKCLKVLIEQSFDKLAIDRTYEKKQRNILTIAALRSDNLAILEYLLSNDYLRFNVNQTDRYQRNAIFYSVFRNRIQAVKLFIVAESVLDLADLRGMTILDYALEYGYD